MCGVSKAELAWGLKKGSCRTCRRAATHFPPTTTTMPPPQTPLPSPKSYNNNNHATPRIGRREGRTNGRTFLGRLCIFFLMILNCACLAICSGAASGRAAMGGVYTI